MLALQYHGIYESHFVPCCSQDCTALDLQWPSTPCPPEGWDVAKCDSAPAQEKETGCAGLCLPSTLLTCGSLDSPRKASSLTWDFMCIAIGYQKGKAERKGCSRERIVLCPSWRKREEEVAACSCSLRRCSFSPHWAWTTWAWRLLREESKAPSHHP